MTNTADYQSQNLHLWQCLLESSRLQINHTCVRVLHINTLLLSHNLQGCSFCSVELCYFFTTETVTYTIWDEKKCRTGIDSGLWECVFPLNAEHHCVLYSLSALRTCTGKHWMRVSSYDTEPCGSSSSLSTATDTESAKIIKRFHLFIYVRTVCTTILWHSNRFYSVFWFPNSMGQQNPAQNTIEHGMDLMVPCWKKP